MSKDIAFRYGYCVLWLFPARRWGQRSQPASLCIPTTWPSLWNIEGGARGRGGGRDRTDCDPLSADHIGRLSHPGHPAQRLAPSSCLCVDKSTTRRSLRPGVVPHSPMCPQAQSSTWLNLQCSFIGTCPVELMARRAKENEQVPTVDNSGAPRGDVWGTAETPERGLNVDGAGGPIHRLMLLNEQKHGTLGKERA